MAQKTNNDLQNTTHETYRSSNMTYIKKIAVNSSAHRSIYLRWSKDIDIT